MPKIILLQGLPGSGKSTFAKQTFDLDPDNTVRLNKDLLREMMHFGEWNNINEKLILETEFALAYQCKMKGKNVIVDDCNLNPKVIGRWMKLSIDLGMEIEVIQLKTPLEECLKRNAARDRQVPPSAIIEMAEKYKETLKVENN